MESATVSFVGPLKFFWTGAAMPKQAAQHNTTQRTRNNVPGEIADSPTVSMDAATKKKKPGEETLEKGDVWSRARAP